MRNIFNRHIFSTVDQEDEKLKVKVNICDSFHEMTLRLTVSMSNYEIIDSKTEIIRVPYQECFDAHKIAQNLIGLKIGAGMGKEINKRVGQKTGCVHINELAFEAAKAVIQSTFPIPHENLSLSDKNKLFKDNFNIDLKSTCQVYDKFYNKGE